MQRFWIPRLPAAVVRLTNISLWISELQNRSKNILWAHRRDAIHIGLGSVTKRSSQSDAVFL